MIEVSISSEAQFGVTWPIWQKLAATVEQLGFAGLYRSDHFTIYAQPPDDASLDTIVSLAWLADHSRRLRFGPLVAPVSMRDPVMLARQAAAMDDLSGGRMVLGIGAGWNEREHNVFGYPLGDKATRFARFEEGLEVITRLLRSDEPVTHHGRFFNLSAAQLLPRPARPGGPRILIGGSGPKRTLPLAARYADVWNGDGLSPEGFRERSLALDGLLQTAGRPPAGVKRTNSLFIVCGRDAAENARRVAGFRKFVTDFAYASDDEIRRTLRTGWNALVGTPAEVVDQIAAQAAAGVQELMLHWVDTDDTEGLHLLGEAVLPQLR
jgi:alkanesulfonate monooxygenase SsuD/methylene tetrahydromethanopterin reductase-like flavin-dependent oxidoreductase (luciferase family)